MNTKTHIQDDEIDLIEIIKKLWQEKVLIIGLSLLFGVLAYGVGTLIPKKFEASVKINKTTNLQFEPFRAYININNINNINKEFFDEFSQKLSSITTFSNFIENSLEGKDFLNYLKEKNISIEQYLSDDNFIKRQVNLRLKNKDDQVPEFIFRYPEVIEGHKVLNQYVLYVANQSFNEFIIQIKTIILSRIDKYEQALKVATSINLEDTIPTSILKGNTGSILNEPNALYYKGAKVLRAEIDNLKQDLNNLTKTEGYNELINTEANVKKNISLLKQIDFKWNPVLQQAIEPQKHISPKKSVYALAGLFFGFFLSLIFIFLRSIKLL